MLIEMATFPPTQVRVGVGPAVIKGEAMGWCFPNLSRSVPMLGPKLVDTAVITKK